METIQEKYQRIRPTLTDGCLFLCSKNKIVSKIIRNCDNSEFSHVGIVFEKFGRWFIMDSNANGVHPDLLSERIDISNNFCFIQPTIGSFYVDKEMKQAIINSEAGISYDFSNGIKELINRKIGTSLRITKRDRHDICSDYTANYAINLEMVTEAFQKLELPFPQDYIRYNDTHTTRILK